MNTIYFRITAYHPADDLSAILDSNGHYEKLWQFSSFLISKGFQVLEVSTDEKFLDVNIEKTETDSEHIFLRAHSKGKPENTTHTLNGKTYLSIKVGDKLYIPDREKKL